MINGDFHALRGCAPPDSVARAARHASVPRRRPAAPSNAAGHERYRYADEEGFDREEEAYERGERAGGYRY